MLIVSPNSTCDVCMESYMDGAGMPHAITCGHIFCRACLDSMQPQCPICRDRFSPQDIRKLRVDSDAPSPMTVAPLVDTQVQHLLDDIANTANGATTLEETQRVVNLCNVYYNAQPDTSYQYTPLRVSYLLLSTLLGAQRKLRSHEDQLSELAAARDDIRDRLTVELDVAQLRYQHSEQARRNEKESARRTEEAFRVNYNKMNALWRSKVEATEHKCQSLREELGRLRQTTQTATHGNIASSVVQRYDTVIPRRTVAEGNSPGVAVKLDKVKLPATLLLGWFILGFYVFILVFFSVVAVGRFFF